MTRATNYLRLLLPALLIGAAMAADPPAPVAAGRYIQAPGSSLRFTFTQLGAEGSGQFRKFTTGFTYREGNPAAGSLEVTIDIASLDTQDAERDEALKAAELFDAKGHATATYVAKSLARGPTGGLEAVGKLTLRGVSKDLRLPLTLKTTANGLELSGQTSIKRLDYGVGQGEWQSTESVDDEVKIQYKVMLVRAK
jgi:polyisoprenoid-binding protein YceI